MATLISDARLQKAVIKFWNNRGNASFDDDGIRKCIAGATLDLTPRTIKGVHHEDNWLKEKLPEKLADEGFVELIWEWFSIPAASISEKAYDAWHHKACEFVLAILKQDFPGHEEQVRYGKAQKIVNMTVKTMYCLAGAENYECHFTYAHMPLDSIILDRWFDLIKYENKTRKKISEDKYYVKSHRSCWSNLNYCGDDMYDNDKKYSYMFLVSLIRDLFNQNASDEHKKDYGIENEYIEYTPFQAEFFIWDERRGENIY